MSSNIKKKKHVEKCKSTLHAQREWGKVIDVGVHIYVGIYVCVNQI